MAVSDPLGITAQGLATIRRQNKRLDFEQLERVMREYEIAEIVVGLPLRMSGAEGIQAEKMQGFAEQLRQRFQFPSTCGTSVSVRLKPTVCFEIQKCQLSEGERW